MEKFIPARPGLDLGLGFNTLNGEARGIAVEGPLANTTLSGMQVKSQTTIVETQEQMMESLKVTVEAGGRYGLFSAEGRFGLAQESSFTSQSTYVVAECTVENAFSSFGKPKLTGDAEARFRDGGEASFKDGYGDAFIRGLRSGGELYAIFQITSTSVEDQSRVAVDVQAEVQGVLAGGSIDVSVENINKSKSSNTSMSMTFYQRAGIDSGIAPVSNPSEILQRIHAFPGIVRVNPVGYLAQIVDYQTIALPPFDKLGLAQREESLEDYLRLKVKYQGIRAEIELIQKNPNMFAFEGTAPSNRDLLNAYDTYTRVINLVNKHARRVANKEIEPILFCAKDYDKDIGELPIFLATKKAPVSDQVEVPDLIGIEKNRAQQILKNLGLNPISNKTYVEAGAAAINVITRQHPSPRTAVAKGSTVVIDYNLNTSEWQQFARHRLVDKHVADFVLIGRHG